MDNPGVVGVVILLLLIAAPVYFVPSFVASHRQHPQRAPIYLVNIFLGWTFLGYVVALVWSVSAFQAPGIMAEDSTPEAASKKCGTCLRIVPAGAQACPGCGSAISGQKQNVCRACGMTIHDAGGPCPNCVKATTANQTTAFVLLALFALMCICLAFAFNVW